eukprot:scaffold3556_cov190-Cylindrotheca_fusiformis.AAC.5
MSVAQRRTQSRFFLFVVWLVSMFAILGSLLKVWDIPGLTDSSLKLEIRNQPAPLACGEDLAFASLPNDPRFCEWNSTLQACREMLLNVVHKAPSWVFLGDTSMAKVADFISQKWPLDPYNATSFRNSCRNLDYYGLLPPKQGWTAPNSSLGEGPINRGIASPYCTDCETCWNVLLEVPSKSLEEEESYVEYLVVEYSRDVSLPTDISTTTQETAAYYLGRKSPAVCIVNIGLHDAAIAPPVSDDLFLRNADLFLGLLQQSCKHVIWIGLSAVVESPLIPQKNCRLKRWNTKMLELIHKRNYDNVSVIDVWKKTMNTDHIAFLAMEERFYFTLARLFISLMAGPASSGL